MSNQTFDNLWFAGFVCVVYLAIPITALYLRRHGSKKVQQRLDKLESSLGSTRGSRQGIKVALVAMGLFVLVSVVLILVLTRNQPN